MVDVGHCTQGMINNGKRNLLGVAISAVDYDAAVTQVLQAAREGRPLAVSALAVHGVMTGVLSAEQRYRLNELDLVLPDGQPVRWALNLLHHTRLVDRVYGPALMIRVCERAAQAGLSVFFYGSTAETLAALRPRLLSRFPQLNIAGMEASKFRRLAPGEKETVVNRIRSSGAHLVFAGLGCPRQEVWAYEFRGALSMPILAVGAAFAFHAGMISQAPAWMQQSGLEWLYRLNREPVRLWRRYLLLNPIYVMLVALQFAGCNPFSGGGRPPTSELLFG